MKKKWFIVLIVTAFLSFSGSSPLPEFFLVGDSISGYYKPYLAKYLAGYVMLESKKDDSQVEDYLDLPGGANTSDSRKALAFLQGQYKNAAFNPDYILLNCGLHDIKRDLETNELQISEQEYRKNLEAIARLLSEHQTRLIWIRTTPVVDHIHNARQTTFRRYAADVAAYNQIADEVCLKYKIPEIDLFTFTKRLGDEQFIDHVHYKEPARNLQGAFIAGGVLSYLDQKGLGLLR